MARPAREPRGLGRLLLRRLRLRRPLTEELDRVRHHLVALTALARLGLPLVVGEASLRHGMGAGRGRHGLRERIEQAGGTMSAGATPEDPSVETEVPARRAAS